MGIGLRIWETVIAEFADVADPERITRLIVRLTVAAVLGGILGFERQRAGKAAGMRTQMIVAMGAALFTLMAEQAGFHEDAMSRVLQGVITGIGFIGAGSIIKLQSDRDVIGLTTAANIWFTTAVGVGAGLGHVFSAAIATALGWVVLGLLPHVGGEKA
jgi:putative Mg2+ transporter-C (MgtC) family protein